jgi:hypothetical protein
MKDDKLTQADLIGRALLEGDHITPLDALRRFGCLRLGARVYDLRRHGLPIERRMVERDGKHYAEYRLGGVV